MERPQGKDELNQSCKENPRCGPKISEETKTEKLMEESEGKIESVSIPKDQKMMSLST